MPNTKGTTSLPFLPIIEKLDDPNTKALQVVEQWARTTVAPYIPYEPTITGTSGAFAYGAGSYNLGRYKRVGPQCNVEIIIFMGGAGFVPGGNTAWKFSLPILPVLAQLPSPWPTKLLGSVFLIPQGAALQYMHAAMANTTGPGGAVLREFTVQLSGQFSNQALTGTVPVMAANTLIHANLSYECAP